MKLINAYVKLLSLHQSVIQTSDISASLNVPLAHASQIAGRLQEAHFFVQLKRGQWAISNQIDPLIIPEYLTAPFPSYISLQSALYHHGMISQISAVVYAISLARSNRFETPLGTFSIHHMRSDFFFGFDLIEKSNIKMASPEKALLDIFYFSPTNTLLFKSLPELELPPTFKIAAARRMIKKIKSSRLRTIVSKRFETVAQSNLCKIH